MYVHVHVYQNYVPNDKDHLSFSFSLLLLSVHLLSCMSIEGLLNVDPVFGVLIVEIGGKGVDCEGGGMEDEVVEGNKGIGGRIG